MTINQRIKFIIEGRNLNKNSFGKAINVLPQTLQNIVGGRENAPSFEVIEKILSTFVDINPSWLVLGKGEPYLEGVVTGNVTGNVTGKGKIIKKNSQLSGFTPPMVTVDEHGTENIVMVETKAAAGYITRLHEPEYYKSLPAFKLPGQRFRNATFRTFEVEGDSMQDTIYNQDWVVGRFLSDFTEIKDGYVHVIVTREDICVKRLLNRVTERGAVVFLSDNDAYNTYEVKAEDIQEIWRVVFKMSPFLPNRNQDVKRLLLALQGDMTSLQSRLERLESNKRS